MREKIKNYEKNLLNEDIKKKYLSQIGPFGEIRLINHNDNLENLNEYELLETT